jgi:LuxR family transcriptional activator of conjugal transfer of Ti plasmids
MAYLEQVALADLCESMQTAANEAGLEAALARFVQRNGFEWFAYIEKSPTTMYGSSSYPAAWQSLYLQRNYVKTDPVLIAAASSATPTRWNGESYAADRRHRDFFGVAADHNVRNGIVIPIAGVYGSFVSLSLAGCNNDNGSPAFDENISFLTLAALHYHLQINRMRELNRQSDQTPHSLLGPRAKTCLIWVARGKTIEETAEILGIHEATVRFHLNDARKRLNAVSLPHLVAEAIKRGEIHY